MPTQDPSWLCASSASGRHVGLEPIAFKDRESFGRADEVQPSMRGLAMGCLLCNCTHIDCRAIVSRRNIHMTDGMTGLLLEQRLRLPRNTCFALRTA
jgi:hypothetical protein